MMIQKIKPLIVLALMSLLIAACGVKGELSHEDSHKKNVPAKAEKMKKQSESAKDWVK